LAIHDCGLAGYRQTLMLQHQLHKKRCNRQIPNTILIAEHPAVVTLGARQSANKLLVDRHILEQRRIELLKIRRGGGATAHNPGQVVFYPILFLDDFGLGISEYIRKLEQIGSELLRQLGVSAQRREGFAGLWVGDTKIASIGVRVSKRVSFHGMAININNDLGIFDLLVPCGLEGLRMTSVLKETNNRQEMSRVKQILAELLMEHFG